MVLAGSLAGCAPETELTQAAQSNVPVDELIGQSMTMTHRIQHVLPDDVITVGAEGTVVVAKDLPANLNAGDEVRITGTVDRRDVYQTDDIPSLQRTLDQGTMMYLIDRDEELILTDATVTPVD